MSPTPRHPTGPEPGSFRDRDSRVFHVDGEVYRALGARALAEWRAMQATSFFPRAIADGRIVGSEEVAAPAGREAELPGTATSWEGFLRHQRIPFVSYPYEWCFGMLQDAALLQLDLLAEALAEGCVLRDATPYNVQWRGAVPTFIDVGSFARLPLGEPWVAYRQFCELFLFPLLLTAYRRVAFQPLLRGALDGIPAAQCRRLLGLRDRLRPGVLVDVVLHSSLSAASADAKQSVRGELRDAGFDRKLIEKNVARLRRIVAGLRWGQERSTWSEYGDAPGYADADREAKRRFVADAVAGRDWRLVWDLGSNTGEYAAIAAARSELVVAMDSDHLAIERLYRRLRAGGEHRGRILPLVVDVADPPPALGWRGRERQTLHERGRPELVLCLALVHHLAITRHLPVDEILDWLADTAEHLVIEHVDRGDPMVTRLLRDKDDAYDDYTRANFETQLERRFAVIRSEQASATRRLYFARRRG